MKEQIMNTGLFSKYNKLSFPSDLFNKRTQSSWRSAIDNNQYIVDRNYGFVFYSLSLDNVQKLEQRWYVIHSKLDELSKFVFGEIKQILTQNPGKSLVIFEEEGIESKYCDYCFMDEKTKEPSIILGFSKDSIESRNALLNYNGSIFDKGSLGLIKLREKQRNLLKRHGVFYVALSLSLVRLIEKQSGYVDCSKQYYEGKLSEHEFRELFRNKIISLNFSGREYLYFFDTNHSRIPELKEICWSDGKIMRLAFGENKC